jgi:ankyrin repeat protein
MIEPEKYKIILRTIDIGTPDDVSKATEGKIPSEEQADKALSEAILSSASFQTIERLCDAGFLPLAKDGYVNSAMHVAAQYGINDVVQLFLMQNRLLLDCKNGCGQTPLFRAVYDGRYETVKLLLAEGANVKITATIPDAKCDRDLSPIALGGLTLLHAAVRSNSAKTQEILQLLVDAGADGSIADNDGNKPEVYIDDPALKAAYISMLATQAHQNAREPWTVKIDSAQNDLTGRTK